MQCFCGRCRNVGIVDPYLTSKPATGQFVIADNIEEGDKVKAEMVFILGKDQIRHLKHINAWYDGLRLTSQPPRLPAGIELSTSLLLGLAL